MKNIYTKYILSILSVIFLFTKNYAQMPQLTKRVMTESEFQKFKQLEGTYEPGKNYNEIINGHGTGLMPPTEEQWEEMKTQPILVDKIEYPLRKLSTPASHDNSATIWFPPIGSQGSEGSCVSWACVYYTKTFQEAREHNWDLSACVWTNGHPSPAYQDKIFSPDFVYHQVNYGGDNGSGYGDNLGVLEQIGCCTWNKMPNDPNDHTTWPNESAWRQAPWYRSQTGWITMITNTDSGIEDLKQLLVGGNLAIISVNADYYSNLTSEDLWTVDNYNPSLTNHANTIVGYDDNYGPFTEQGNSNAYGAFKVANSWGKGWRGDGFYYISYECLKQRVKQIYLYDNNVDYVPQMVAVFEMYNCFRHDNVITFGLGDPYSPIFTKCPLSVSLTGGNCPYPNDPTVVDITEFIPYMSESVNRFYMSVHKLYGSTTAVLQYFSIEKYDDYSSGIPKNVYVSSETPIIGPQQDRTVSVNAYTTSESIYITYPSGGEIFEIGSSPIITYASEGTSGYVNIDYSTDRGTTWNTIANNTIDNGIYTGWIVPFTPAIECKIRISDVDGNPSTISKGLFRIGTGADEFTEQTSISLPGVFFGSWGDFDNDGDLDILLNNPVSKIYCNNGNNAFEEQSISFIDIANGLWGDYDNDGDLDILLIGYTGSEYVSKIYKNNGNNTFDEQSISLTGVSSGSAAWGDYDNDGDLDILLTGYSGSSPLSKIYRNNGDNTFTDQTSISLIGVYSSSVAWGDYDNDGDLDILLTGEVSDNNYVSKIYRNDGNNTFTAQVSLTGVFDCSAAWGDYDNDGDLDILLTGNSATGPISKIYRNNGNDTFEEQSISLTGVSGSFAAWGDYDNDGYLDILLSGYSGISYITKLYHNDGINSFTEQTSINLTGVSGQVAWGDYDNDGDLDILLTGYNGSDAISKIYSNNNSTSNTLPSAPSNLQAAVNGMDVTFSWDKSTDNETPQNGLHYNLVIGTTVNCVDKLSPMSDRSNGYRRVVRLGNSQTNSWTIKGLPDGQYYWSIQAIDNAFAGSNFAATQTFTVGNVFSQFTEQTDISLTGVSASSAAWGDYDNDGDLDIVLTGYVGGNLVSKIYRNEANNIFTEQSDISLVGGSPVCWGDYDNDGYLDIFLNNRIYHNNGNNTFTEKASIPDIGVSSAAWGDYDNDGDLDILVTGWAGMDTYVSKIYRNDGEGTFTDQTSIHLRGVGLSSVAWGDYDNDGDLDILLVGQYRESYRLIQVSKIYRNNGDNTFTDLSSTIHITSGVYEGSVAWGDYDDDGDLDILLAGGGHFEINRNDGNNVFTKISIPLLIGNCSAVWGDYDNDGDLDILITGFTDEPISKIYRNDGDDTFTEQTSISLTGISGGSAVWGDYDNDGDLDILLAGSGLSKIYRNNNPISNTVPSSPSNLQAVINGNDVTFSWDKSTDNETSQNGLHYNLVIGTTANGVDKLSPMSDWPNGYRRVVRLGNSQTNSWTIKNNLLTGHYYWSVQAIDNCFAGSEFASGQDIPLPVELTAFTAEIINSFIKLTWQTATEINNYGFEVERSSISPATDWIKIGFVKGSGNSNSPKSYEYVDMKPFEGNKFVYRLKQIDNDGTFKYSEEIDITIIPNAFGLSQNYPNPFNPSTKIDYQLPCDSKVTIELYSITGDLVSTIVSNELAAGYYSTEINAGKLNLSSGVYFYKISAVSQAAGAQAFVKVNKLIILK